MLCDTTLFTVRENGTTSTPSAPSGQGGHRNIDSFDKFSNLVIIRLIVFTVKDTDFSTHMAGFGPHSRHLQNLSADQNNTGDIFTVFERHNDVSA
jgi:hypothetical protein